MSIFKLSGNMALGSSGNYPPSQDISDIKNSLRLLKAKQANKRNFDIPENNYQGYNYNNQYQAPQTDPVQRRPKPDNYSNNYNYADIAKNHMPPGYNHSSATAPENQKYRSNQQDPSLNYKQGSDMSDKYASKNSSLSNKYTVDSLDRQRTNSYSHQSKNASSNGNYDQGYSKNYGQRGNVNKYEQMVYEKTQNNVRVRGRGNTYDADQFVSNVKGSEGSYGKNGYSNSKQPDYGNAYARSNQNNEIKRNQERNNSYEQPSKPVRRNEPQYNNVRNQSKSQKYNVHNQNPITEKPIKEVNQQNRLDIVQYDPKQFVKCRQGCGRKFNPDSLQKHQGICKKVFQRKRKQFDAAQQRIPDDQQAKYVHQAQREIKKPNNPNQSKKPQGKASKLPKWKAESEAFRIALKQNRGANLSQKEQKNMKDIEAAQQDGMVKCPYCGRTFSEKAGPRHVTFCEQQAKKKGIKRR